MRVKLWRLLRMVAATAGAMVIGIVRAAAARTACRSTPAQLRPGDRAPDFSLPGSDGRTYRLGDLAGFTVVIAWFPKAFTGG